MKDFSRLNRLPLLMAMVSAALLAPFSARANVFASDIKVNGSALGTTASLGSAVTISYLLNEPANVGATINILSNGVSIRAIAVPASALGTNGAGLSQGVNTVVWDGRDANGNIVGSGIYAVSITATAAGHAGWALLATNAIVTNAASGGYYAFAPRGIAVDTVSNSPYYGRVFVANAASGPSVSNAGDQDAILKFNVDGTAADDGEVGTGGYAMQDDDFALPQKLRTAGDDRVYMNDYANGYIVAFDPALNTNEIALAPLNYLANPFFENSSYYNGFGWFAFDISATETTNGPTGLIWLGDYGTGGSGIWYWNLDDGVADATNNTGDWAVAAGAGNSLRLDVSGGFMTASNYQVFAGQFVDGAGDTNYRCLMFTNADGFVGTNAIPTSNAVWAVGAGDDTFRDVFDTTINARAGAQFVACAMAGPHAEGIRLLNAATGATTVANLDAANTYYATAWDAVTNLYAVSGSLHGWRVWSPPGGANSSTTIGQATITETSGSTAIHLVILNIGVTNDEVTISFAAPATNTPANFKLFSSTNVAGGYAADSQAVFGGSAMPGIFTATTPVEGSAQFYLIEE